MKLYLVESKLPMDWDTYDKIIVAARNEEEAKFIKPLAEKALYRTSWVTQIEDLVVTCIGTAKKGTQPSIILESYNAG